MLAAPCFECSIMTCVTLGGLGAAGLPGEHGRLWGRQLSGGVSQGLELAPRDGTSTGDAIGLFLFPPGSCPWCRLALSSRLCVLHPSFHCSTLVAPLPLAVSYSVCMFIC